MDIICQYYDQEFLVTKEDCGWSWILSLSIDNHPIVVSSSLYFKTSVMAEQSAVKAIKGFFACYAIYGVLSSCKTKKIISEAEHDLLIDNIVNSPFDF